MSKKRLLFCLCLFLLCFPNLYAQHESVLDLYKNYQTLVKKYLVKSDELHQYFTIDGRGIGMYASPQDKKNDKAECFIFWDELEQFRKMFLHASREEQLKYYLAKKNARLSQAERKHFDWLAGSRVNLTAVKQPAKGPLSGYRIAIDPGHIAGDMEMARLEQRFIEIDLSKQQKITFCEGDLTLTTALLLKKKLEAQGASVMLSRSKANATTSGKDYSHWLREDLPGILQKEVKEGRLSREQMKKILQSPKTNHVYENYFLSWDLKERARLINAFQPHVTVVIHFNADPERKQWNKPTKNNYSMVFVPGAFLRNELDETEERLDFLRLLLLQNFSRSQLLSERIQKQFVGYLKVPAIPNNRLFYLKHYSTCLSQGVYARNLGLCRLINSPICYGESLYQDNEKEMKLLHTNDSANNKPAARIVQVAEAYYQGILNYFKSLKNG